MLEFVSSGGTYDVFTFAVPPESEELVFPQRISEVKTFGGSVFDLYGNDTIPITIQGSTINEDEKVIYRGLTRAPMYMTGTQEIFHLQEVIHSWSGDPYLKNKKIYLYSLSRMSVAEIGIRARGNPVNCLPVHIKSLKIVRNKSNPHAYRYTLDLIAYRDETLATSLSAGISSGISKIAQAAGVISKAVKVARATGDMMGRLNSFVIKAKDAYDRIKERGLAATATDIMLSAASGADTVTRILTGDSGTFYRAAIAALDTANTVEYMVRTEESGGSKKTSEDRGLHTVSFDSNGGSYIPSRKIDPRGTVSAPPEPSKDRHRFGGWYRDQALTIPFNFSDEITEDMTLYARWRMMSALVRFMSGGGSDVPQQIVEIGSVIQEPAPPARIGYQFMGWFMDPGLTALFDFGMAITADTIIYAGWSVTRSVSFVTDGGSPVDTQQVADGDTAIYPPVPDRDDHLFICWCEDPQLSSEYDFRRPVTQDLVLYAKWQRITYSVIFDVNGGSAVQPQHVTPGGFATPPSPAPVKEGSTLDGWYSNIELTEPYSFLTPVNSDIRLYAGWAVITHTATFSSGGGSSVDTQSVRYGGRVLYPPVPSRSGHIFVGWYRDQELTEPFDFSEKIYEDITLYAGWHEDLV